MEESFGIERGEAFMSIVHALDRETRLSEHVLTSVASGELDWMLTGRAARAVSAVPQVPAVQASPAVPASTQREVEPARLPQAVPARVPEATRPAAPAASVVAHEKEPARPAVAPLVDDLTGIGGPLALRRDLMLESALPSIGGPRYALIAIDVQPVAEVRRRAGDAVADRLMKTLVEAVRASVRPSDSIYRSGPHELTLLLRGRSPGVGEQARFELQRALREALAERGLPSVRLAPATSGRSRGAVRPPVANETGRAAAV